MHREPPDRAPEPFLAADDKRCDTRALDLGAVRAIHAAYVVGTGQTSAAEAAPPLIERSEEGEGAPTDRDAPVPAPVQPSAGDEAPDRDERPGSERPRVDARERGGGAAAPAPEAATIEIDYSPASRLARERSIRVQRAARAAVAGCLVAAGLLGALALVRAGRAPLAPGQAALTAQQSAQIAGETAAGAPAPAAETAPGARPATTMAPSSSAPAPGGGTEAFLYPNSQIQNTFSSARASGAAGPAPSGRGVPGARRGVAPGPAGTGAPPAAGPPAATLPGGTVELPIPE